MGTAEAAKILISIHALREEGDFLGHHVRDTGIKFLSTPSARRATGIAERTWITFCSFLSTPSARRATIPPPYAMGEARYFYPRPPRGGRRLGQNRTMYQSPFLSTPSARRATG